MPEMEPASIADKTGSKPVDASANEQENKREDAKAATPAATDSQAPVSIPPTSDDASPKAPPTSDSTASPSAAPTTNDQITVTGATLKRDPTPNPDQSLEPEEKEEPAPSTTAGGPTEQPSSGPTNRQLELQRRKSLIVHNRLAKFFTWILLLGFVILPGTFSRTNGGGSGNKVIDEIANLPLLVVGYFCCGLNACAVCWLWYLRSDDPEWLYVNLFFAGLINAFSGLVTTFVNIYAAQNGTYGAASYSVLIVVATCTAIYAVLTVIFYRKSVRARYQQARRNSGIV